MCLLVVSFCLWLSPFCSVTGCPACPALGGRYPVASSLPSGSLPHVGLCAALVCAWHSSDPFGFGLGWGSTCRHSVCDTHPPGAGPRVPGTRSAWGGCVGISVALPSGSCSREEAGDQPGLTGRPPPHTPTHQQCLCLYRGFRWELRHFLHLGQLRDT